MTSFRNVAVLQAPSRERPATITRHEDGGLSASGVSANLALGARVHVEVQNPANGDAIYTVPASKTFTGSVVLIGVLPPGASIGVSAATGGSQASVTAGAATRPESVTPVTIAGGAGGNALTATVSGSPYGVSLIIDGYVK